MSLLWRMHMLLWGCSHGNFLLSGLGGPYPTSKLTLICTTSNGEATTRVTTRFLWRRLNPCLEAVKLQHISARLTDRFGQRWRRTNVAGRKGRGRNNKRKNSWRGINLSFLWLNWKWSSNSLTETVLVLTYRLEIQTSRRKGKADTQLTQASEQLNILTTLLSFFSMQHQTVAMNEIKQNNWYLRFIYDQYIDPIAFIKRNSVLNVSKLQ